jgi:tripartite-type tricarboxylate transporter receptor subunit TctC
MNRKQVVVAPRHRPCSFGAVNTIVFAMAAFFYFIMPLPAQSQAPYPSRAIKFVVPYQAGGLPDTVARIVARRLQERLHQPFVVENRPGANGGIAAAALANASADGYTFMITDGALLSINPLIDAKLSYRPQDLVPVALLARAPLFLAVHPKVPVGTLNEFIEYVKARPGQLNYGSSGVGSVHHLSMEAMKASLQLDMTHVPFKGTGESVPALLGGHVQVLFSAYPSLSGGVEGNRVKVLATNGAERSPQAPNLPAVAELIPGFDFASLVGILARTGTPSFAIQKIALEVVAVVNEAEVVQQLKVVGVESVGLGPDDFDRAIKSEIERVAKVVKATGIKLN